VNGAQQSKPLPLKVPRKEPLTLKQATLDRPKINVQALPQLPAIVKRLLPKGRVKGRYWQAPLFPQGHEQMNLSVDLVDGTWRDFHSAKKGSDLQSLISYIAKLDDLGAQLALRQMIGVE
jgi:hypothetical protein